MDLAFGKNATSHNSSDEKRLQRYNFIFNYANF